MYQVTVIGQGGKEWTLLIDVDCIDKCMKITDDLKLKVKRTRLSDHASELAVLKFDSPPKGTYH